MGKPNLFGAFTLCSFAPIATIAMFVLALAVYSFANKRKLLLYGSLSILLLTSGFTGFWIYNARLPMESITVDMSIDYYYFGYDHSWENNVSSISFNLILHNALMRDAPAFRVEYYDYYINGKKLELRTYQLLGDGGGMNMFRGLRWIWTPIILESNETKTLTAYVTLILGSTRVEGGTIEDIWTPLSNRIFSFRMDGVLVSRSYYETGPENSDSYVVWASKPFSISCTYHE